MEQLEERCKDKKEGLGQENSPPVVLDKKTRQVKGERNRCGRSFQQHMREQNKTGVLEKGKTKWTGGEEEEA